jgi:hypothetical protein
LATVLIGPDGRLRIHDTSGPLPGEYTADGAGVTSVLRGLEALARVQVLKALAGRSPWALNAPIALEWGTVREGVRSPLRHSNEVVHAGDRVYLSVRNTAKGTVYVSLIDIGVSGQITVLTDDWPSGRRLAPEQEYVFGYEDFDGVLPGVQLTWPEGLESAGRRPETVLLLVTEARQDVSVLAQRGVGRTPAVSNRDSPLLGLLGQAVGRREFERPRRGERVVRYDVHAIEFELDPVQSVSSQM